MAQDFARDAAREGKDAVAGAKAPRQPPGQPAPVDEPVIQRMHDDDEAALTVAPGEGGDNLVQCLARIGKGRVGADLEIGRELQRKDEIGARRRP